MQTKTKKNIISCGVLVLSVALVVFGWAWKNSRAAGVGSSTGMGNAGDPMYVTRVFYASSSKFGVDDEPSDHGADFANDGIQGYYLGTLTATEILGIEYLVQIHVYYDYNWGEETDEEGLPICMAAWDFANGDKYARSCWWNGQWKSHKTGGVGDQFVYNTAKFRIINVVTDDLGLTGLCDLDDTPAAHCL